MLSTPPYNEKELCALIVTGNETAFRQLFDTYNQQLFSFAVEMTKSAADAEEIVQDCFTKIWLRKEKITTIDHIGQYLYKMVRNQTLDYLRKTASDQFRIAQVWANLSQTDNSIEEHFNKLDTEQLIEQALLQLSPQKQEVYRLSREKEYTHEQISTLTGLSKSRVSNILVEALKHIKAQLEKQSGSLGLLFWIWTWEKFF